ncbi:replication factor C subunit 2/4 [Plasmodium vinckei petteri]|uniref:Replication factor C subunit 2/4 n=1 Tax=Plasmodium vinckei petteri TaxID=138298 RepID=W7B941_PLAVN|nr:replication factor C subunit 2/4 [Plasmodium vinckei petteri]CAD2114321.1 replication factor C subunit 4, putative [Plasmodium vinckei petteri]
MEEDSFKNRLLKRNIDIWIEKYRPEYLEDVVGNPFVINTLKSIIVSGNMPNLLLAGAPGTGKTTSILCLASEMLGSQAKKAVLELNASDDRGINVIRDRIKSFAKEVISLPPGRHKIIILDEVDSMTTAAQQSLRRIMELYSDTTRFALACNQSEKIIDALQSRCAIIRYFKLTDDQVLKRILKICEYENIKYTDDGLETITFIADGDLRKAVNCLQSTYAGLEVINKENVLNICDIPSPERIENLLKHCLSSEWRKAHDIAYDMIKEGHTPFDVALTSSNVLRRYDLGSEAIQIEFLKIGAMACNTMASGLSSVIQLDKLIADWCIAAKTLRAKC